MGTIQDKKDQAEIEKLEAEKDFFEVQTAIFKKPVYKRPAVYMPLFIAILTSIFGNVSFIYEKNEKSKVTVEKNKATVEKNKATIEKNKAIKQSSEDKDALVVKTSYAKALDKVIESNKNIIPASVDIKFKGEIKRELMTKLQVLFNNSGFLTGRNRAERTSKINNSIISYHNGYKDSAKKLMKITNSFLIDNGCNTVVNLDEGQLSETDKSKIKLLIYGNCN